MRKKRPNILVEVVLDQSAHTCSLKR